jgi:hypothetical protein
MEMNFKVLRSADFFFAVCALPRPSILSASVTLLQNLGADYCGSSTI